MIATVRPWAAEHVALPATWGQEQCPGVVLKEPAGEVATGPAADASDSHRAAGTARAPEDAHESFSESMIDGEFCFY